LSSGIQWITSAAACIYPTSYLGYGSPNAGCHYSSIYQPTDATQQASRTAATALGMGAKNTSRMWDLFEGPCALNSYDYTRCVSLSTHAMGIAYSYTNNSKYDWGLPSRLELNQLCRYAWNLAVDNTATTCSGMSGSIRAGFSTGTYWSSSEDASEAGCCWLLWVYSQNFSTGQLLYSQKSDTFYVRPVRAF
jgi:hypothetical protein